MSAHWTDRLSEYLDGELTTAEGAALEAHLPTCDACAATLRELREVVDAAHRLEAAPPAADLWPGIARRLAPRRGAGRGAGVIGRAGAGRTRRRVMMTVPQLAAAGIALAMLSATGAWLALGGSIGGPAATAPVGAAEPAAGVVATATFASSWEPAIVELESEFAARRASLDPETIMVVERNLAIIDQAITEARRALEADPSSAFLNGYVAEAMRRKVDLLRQATRIQRTET